MGTLERELQKIHDAGIGVSITWLSDGRVDLRLVHKSGGDRGRRECQGGCPRLAVVGGRDQVALSEGRLCTRRRFRCRELQEARSEQCARELEGKWFEPRDYTVNGRPITDGGA
jgi:hypothetical protein